MPIDKNGKEPGQKGYTLEGMEGKKKAQAQAILISMAKKEGKIRNA
jgi:hypothetical protein